MSSARSRSGARPSPPRRATGGSRTRHGWATRSSGGSCRPTWRAAPLAESLLADADLGWRDGERVGFVVHNVVDAAAPSNNPLLSPAAWKALVDTGGLSAVRGARAFASDMATAPRVPAMVAPDAFEVGRDLAVSPGAVVRRAEICELIQYEPTTPRVHEFPLVIVPPMINKFYVTDLAPGRSMIEYLVSQGHQVFAISWRNPDARHRDWGTDAYGQAIVDALNAARSICGAAKASIFALCSGGIVSSMVAAHLADTGGLDAARVAVPRGDRARPGAGGHGGGAGRRAAAALAVAASRSRGYLDGRSLAEVFAWLRPNDLIWNYWVNNYLQGKTPPPFDILYWNADTTRLPAALHRDFINIALTSALAKPDAVTMLGSPVDLSAGRRGLLPGGRHRRPPVPVAVLLPQHPAARRRRPVRAVHQRAHRVDDQPAGQPEGEIPGGAGRGSIRPTRPTHGTGCGRPRPCRAAGGRTTPSWLAERSGGEKDRPDALGDKGFEPMEPAPGLYVLDR